MNWQYLRTKGFITCLTIFASILHSSLAFAQKPYHSANIAVKDRKLSSNYLSAKNDQPKWEFRTAPIAMLASWATLDVSFRVTDQWATGPAIVLYNSQDVGGMLAPAYKGQAIGWNANYYFTSAHTRTWYLSAHAYYETYKSYLHDYLGYKELDGFRGNTAFGYQWKWSRINFMSGVGLEYRSHKVADWIYSASDVNQAQGTTSTNSFGLPHIEFKIGLEI